MKLYKQLRRVSLIVLLGSAALSAKPGPAHIVLRAEVDTQADTVLLTHLLPGHAPEDLKRSVEGIALGAAPRPGSIRRLSRSTVMGVLEANGISATMFDVPDSIQIRRTGRELTGEEVWAAIHASLSSTSSQAMIGLKPEDIRFDSSIVVPAAGTRLKLAQATYDPLLGETRFRMVSSGDPSILPFYVTAKLASAATKSSAAENRSGEGFARSLILVQPKSLATLRLHSPNSESMLRVQPLTAGRLGEIVPVRLLTTRRTLKARVVDFGLLDAAF